jgi:hypothetical protein
VQLQLGPDSRHPVPVQIPWVLVMPMGKLRRMRRPVREAHRLRVRKSLWLHGTAVVTSVSIPFSKVLRAKDGIYLAQQRVVVDTVERCNSSR